MVVTLKKKRQKVFMHSLRKNSNAWSSPDSFVTDGGRHQVANSSGEREEVVKLVTNTGVAFEKVKKEIGSEF